MRPFSLMVYRFLHYLKVVKQASDHTIRNYCLDLEAFKFFFETRVLNITPPSSKLDYKNLTLKPEGFGIELIDKRALRAYLADQAAKQSTKKTVLRRLSALRSFFRFLLKEKVVTYNPLDEIESPKGEKKLPQSLCYEQVEHLMAQPDTTSYLGLRDRCIMELLYSSALRISEVAAMNREDIDKQAKVIRVMGKGKKQRMIPITETAVRWIVSYLDHHDRPEEADSRAVFLNKWGKRISVRSLDRNFESYLLKSGLSGRITPHTIRHTIATHWLEKGMDLKTIQILLGHSSLATTTIYTQVSTRLKRDVYDKAHPLSFVKENVDD